MTNMNVRIFDEVLDVWLKRHGLQLSDVYRDQFIMSTFLTTLVVSTRSVFPKKISLN